MRGINTIFEKVYMEAEMLNEMNPKLRALLAAGLIGTAGLGAMLASGDYNHYESGENRQN